MDFEGKKLSVYVVRVDSGFAPNPFWGYCTLACCKPAIRRNADVGDIVVGITSTSDTASPELVYAMLVEEIILMDDYWHDARFEAKKPSAQSPRSRCGDNMWQKQGRFWKRANHGLHTQESLERDVGGHNVLVSRKYFYFGEQSIIIPKIFSRVLSPVRGHRNLLDPILISKIWSWVKAEACKPRLNGLPRHFMGSRCEVPRADRYEAAERHTRH